MRTAFETAAVAFAMFSARVPVPRSRCGTDSNTAVRAVRLPAGGGCRAALRMVGLGGGLAALGFHARWCCARHGPVPCCGCSADRGHPPGRLRRTPATRGPAAPLPRRAGRRYCSDRRLGAFAAIRLWRVLHRGLSGPVRRRWRRHLGAAFCMGIGFVLERALSGFGDRVRFRWRKIPGLAHTFATAAGRSAVRRDACWQCALY